MNKRLNPAIVITIACIKSYQWISALFKTCPSCRFYPSCSHYALQALEKYGFIKGGILTIRRVTRCHPWGGEGIDEVP